MEKISFEVAKVIKKAGYPQDYRTTTYYSNESEDFSGYGYQEGDEISYDAVHKNQIEAVAAPTYLEVWLWLWREKRIEIEVFIGIASEKMWTMQTCGHDFGDTYSDPEEAIEQVIKYLVENNLIK